MPGRLPKALQSQLGSSMSPPQLPSVRARYSVWGQESGSVRWYSGTIHCVKCYLEQDISARTMIIRTRDRHVEESPTHGVTQGEHLAPSSNKHRRAQDSQRDKRIIAKIFKITRFGRLVCHDFTNGKCALHQRFKYIYNKIYKFNKLMGLFSCLLGMCCEMMLILRYKIKYTE